MRIGKAFGLFAACGIAISSFAQLPPEDARAQERAVSRLVERSANVRLFRTGTVLHRIYGAPFAVGTDPKDAAQTFAAEFSDVFGIGDGRLVFEGTQDILMGKFTAVYFQEHLEGLPVDGGYVMLLVKNGITNPVVLASISAKHVEGPVPKPRISGPEAVNFLKKRHPGYKQFSEPALKVWRGEDGAHLAWAFYADNPDIPQDHEGGLPERVLAFVDAVDGTILERRNQVFPIDVSGNVSGWASPGLKPDQSNNPETIQPIDLLRVSISGGNSALTGTNGNYLIPHPGTAPVTVNATLQGPWVNVINTAGPNLTMSQSVTPPGPANFLFNPGRAEFDTSQVNGMIHTTKVHNYAKAYVPTFPGIDIAIPCRVNISSTCNAYYSSSTINFYRAGGNCPNMCYSTIVYHEYGHFLVDKGHNAPTGDFHEGMSDVTANLLADNPWVGEDFFGQNTGPLRSAYNNIRYPCSGGPHTCGQVLSGSFWLTLDQLDITEGHAVGLDLVRSWSLNLILLRPPAVDPGITIDVLTLDDDDANLQNGTPHYDEIAAGFGAKGLNAPPLEWVLITPLQVPGQFVPASSTGQGINFRVRVADNASTLNPSSVRLHYRFDDGPWQQAAMPEVGDPRIFETILLEPPCGTEVDWYISARDNQNHTSTFPQGAPGNHFTFLLARSLNTIFLDTFETNLGWTVVNENLQGGAWVRVEPVGTVWNGQQAQPETDSPDFGSLCYVTGQGVFGGPAWAADVDGGPTNLVSRNFDLAGADALIEYRRWFYNDSGFDRMYVQVSNDGGATWVNVEAVSGLQNAWTTRQFRVGQFVTPTATVRIRFSVADDPPDSIVEGGVDHVVVRRIECR